MAILGFNSLVFASGYDSDEERAPLLTGSSSDTEELEQSPQDDTAQVSEKVKQWTETFQTTRFGPITRTPENVSFGGLIAKSIDSNTLFFRLKIGIEMSRDEFISAIKNAGIWKEPSTSK